MGLVIVLALLLAVVVEGAGREASAGARRPSVNILFLQCDEMDGRVLDPSHPLSKVTQMPNLARLLARGVNFVSTYAENPLCAPSRASTFTGRRTASIRVWNNVKAIAALIDDPSRPDPVCAKIVGYGAEWCVAEGRRQNVTTSIRHALVSLGYDFQVYGKMDTGGGVCRAGLDDCDGTGYHDNGNWSTSPPAKMTYYPGDLIHSWAGSAGIDRPVFMPLDARNGWINEANAGGGPFPTDWPYINKCVDFLRKLAPAPAAPAASAPFALYCSVLDPHPPYFTNATWLAQIDDDALDATINATRWQPIELVHPADRFQFAAEGVPGSYDRALARRLARAWHGQTAETDAMMGAVLDALDASPAAESTFILFTSDHGEMHLEHRHVEKMTHYEGSARVPLVIAGPGIPRGRTETTLTSLLDVFPTFIDVGGAAPPGFSDGYSVLPLVVGAVSNDKRPRPDHVAAMAASDSLNAGQFMLRQGKWKLIAYATAASPEAFPPQLFDISTDIWEMHNVAEQNPAVVASMDAVLRAQIDYPAVMVEYEAQGRDWARRWTAAFPNQGWRPLLHAAYRNLSAADEAKFERWLALG